MLGRIVAGVGLGCVCVCLCVCVCMYVCARACMHMFWCLMQPPIYTHRVLYQVTPLYVAEISPEKLRGRLMSFLNVYATLGALVSLWLLCYVAVGE